jgi:hypothetical protein
MARCRNTPSWSTHVGHQSLVTGRGEAGGWFKDWSSTCVEDDGDVEDDGWNGWVHARRIARLTPLITALRLATTMFLSMPTPKSVEPSARRSST